MLDCWSRRFAAATLASFLCGSTLLAQAGLTHIGDASTPARGTFRLHAVTAWTRYDARFTGTGEEPLGAFLTADSLGVREIPRLSVAESLVTEPGFEEIECREQTLDRIRRTLLDKGPHGVALLLVTTLQSGQDQILFGFEVSVQRRLGDPRLCDDQVDTRGVVTVLVEQPECGLEQMISNL